MRLMKKKLLASRQRQQLHKKEPDGVRKLQGMLAFVALCTACRLSGLCHCVPCWRCVTLDHHMLMVHCLHDLHILLDLGPQAAAG